MRTSLLTLVRCILLVITYNCMASNVKYNNNIGSFKEHRLQYRTITYSPTRIQEKPSFKSIDTDRKCSIDIYPLLMLFGEFGMQFDLNMIEQLNLGLHVTYFDPKLGVISNSLIGAFIEPEDAIEINARTLTPGISVTHYFKQSFEGWYLGGLLLYKNCGGTIMFEDKFSRDLTYRGIIQANIGAHSVSFNVNSGYRIVLDNGISFRFGGGLGYQIGKNTTTYTIIQAYDPVEGLGSKQDLEDVLDIYYDTVVKPVSFFMSIGIGKTF